MKITRNIIFRGILFFGLITNFLVYLDIQNFYLRAIFSFVFLSTIPGLLILLILKIRKTNFWEYLVYSIGLSIGFIMFSGLAVNWILPWLTITDKPLSLIPLQISFNTILLVLSLFAYIRNKDITFTYKVKKFNRLDTFLFTISMFIPLISILGAMTLNNGGSNTLALVNYIMICVSIFVVYTNRQRVDKRIYPFLILMISTSLLLSGWLRGNYVSGVDINQEYQVFQITKANLMWKITDYYNAYNSCLSLNILPTVLSTFLNINDQYIFKIIVPIIFSITPVTVYLISKNYLIESLSLLAAFFFMSQPTFTSWTLTPIRQEIAFTLFSISILVLHNKSIDFTVRKLLFIIFSITMIVSHYSSAYMAVAIYSLTYIIFKISKYIGRSKNLNNYYPSLLSLKTLVILLGFTYIWYSQITFGFGNVTLFLNNGIKNIGSIFTSSVQAQGQSVFDQLNIFYRQNIGTEMLENYTKVTIETFRQNNPYEIFYNSKLISNYPTNYYVIPGFAYSPNLLRISIIFRNLLKILGELLVVAGILYYGIITKERRKGNLFLNIATLVVMLLATITPFISIDYDLLRSYQQTLLVFSFAVVFGLSTINNKTKSNLLSNITHVFFILYFLFLSRFTQQFVGGTDISMIFNNTGIEYSMYYTHKSDITSGEWMSGNFLTENTVVADKYADTKLRLTSFSEHEGKIVNDVLPAIISKNSYVYLDYTNTKNKVAFKPYKGNTLTYNFPTEFLNDNKNLVYNNGGSEIFK